MQASARPGAGSFEKSQRSHRWAPATGVSDTREELHSSATIATELDEVKLRGVLFSGVGLAGCTLSFLRLPNLGFLVEAVGALELLAMSLVPLIVRLDLLAFFIIVTSRDWCDESGT